MGRNSSVSARILHDFPGVTIQKCICHSLHLVASEACKAIPRRCEDMARNIYNFFKSSDKRRSELKEFQMFCEVEPHVILRPAQTRWLSLLEVVKRINEQWAPLTLYFTEKRFDAQLVIAETILQQLQDPQVKIFYAFLEYILGQIVSANAYFQSEKVVIADTYTKMLSLLKNLLKLYMSAQYVDSTEPCDLDPQREDTFIYLHSMYLGVKVLDLMQKCENNDMKEDTYKRCRQFLMTACMQIKLRYDFSNKLFLLLNNISPAKVLDTNHRLPSLYDLMKLVPRIIDTNIASDLQVIDDEWRNLINYVSKLKDFQKEEPDVFWSQISKLQAGNDTFLFKNVANFCLNLLSLPHSNATCERIFSKVNLIKTKTRNKLITDTVNGLLLSSQCVREHKSCVLFTPTDKMISYVQNSNILYKNSESLDLGEAIEDNVSQQIIL